jgi:hypothetical protein
LYPKAVRFNPINYLHQKKFNEENLHSNRGSPSASNVRQQADLERKFGANQTEQESVRNKTKTYEV